MIYLLYFLDFLPDDLLYDLVEDFGDLRDDFGDLP
jgi:hypothetical protein